MTSMINILYWLPPIILLLLVIFLVIFFRTDIFRKYRIRYKIYKSMIMKLIKHTYNYAKYLIKVAALLKLVLYLAIFILFVASLVIVVVFFYNNYIVPLLSSLIELSPISFSLSGLTQTLFSSRINPLYFIGVLAGAILSAFMRPKLEHFSVRVKSKKTVIYVFGSNQLVHDFVKSLCNMGFGPLVALIAEKEKPWMMEVKTYIDLLTLDTPEALADEILYNKIEFKNALKVLILVDEPQLAQHILVNVRKVNPDVPIILLSRNKPPLLDLVGKSIKNVVVLDDIDLTSRELVRRLGLGFAYATAIEAPVPKDYVGRRPSDIESDFDHRIKVLAVKRAARIFMPEKFEQNDILILYLVDSKVLREFLQLLPISPFEELRPLVGQEVETEQTERENGSNKGKDSYPGESR